MSYFERENAATANVLPGHTASYVVVSCYIGNQWNLLQGKEWNGLWTQSCPDYNCQDMKGPFSLGAGASHSVCW